MNKEFVIPCLGTALLTAIIVYFVASGIKYETVHPMNHCVQLTMSESRQNGKPIEAKSAAEICVTMYKTDKSILPQ